MIDIYRVWWDASFPGCGCDTLLIKHLAIRLGEPNTLAKSPVMAQASRLREQPLATPPAPPTMSHRVGIAIRACGAPAPPLCRAQPAQYHFLKIPRDEFRGRILSGVASPQAGPLLFAAARTVIAFVQDPDGYKIELIQHG